MTHFAPSALPTDTEMDAMAGVLLRRYGTRADAVAAHFMAEHDAAGDSVRAGLWREVRARIGAMGPSPTLS